MEARFDRLEGKLDRVVDADVRIRERLARLEAENDRAWEGSTSLLSWGRLDCRVGRRRATDVGGPAQCRDSLRRHVSSVPPKNRA
jgi:hypothetical protein